MTQPDDADARRSKALVICYPNGNLPEPDMEGYRKALKKAKLVKERRVPPREARAILIPAGHFLRILSVDGPQVGDLNLFHASDLSECFYSGKTRALHGSHVSEGDRLWSTFPYLRPMATIVTDTLSWYGTDADGGRVHDVIGTRCDPYTNSLLGGGDYHYCCHSNLIRALADFAEISLSDAERHVHDVLNVFMCTGFMPDTGQYFMKASPVRPGDHFDLFAEMDLIAVLSACPGGDCGSEHSSDVAKCHPLDMQCLKPKKNALPNWQPPETNRYDRSHGV